MNSLKFNQNIELKNISFDYDNDNEIIDNLNLTIHKNDIIGILVKVVQENQRLLIF